MELNNIENILKVENLNKHYLDSQFELKDISFSIPYGSIVGFIGKNGAKKNVYNGSNIRCINKG